MTLNNAEFINRHHKTKEQGQSQHRLLMDLPGGGLGTVIFLLYAVAVGVGLYVLYERNVARDLLPLTGAQFLLLGLVFFWAYLRRQSERQVALLKDSVLEGSRAARMVTDAKDRAVYSNKKFRNLIGAGCSPSLQSLSDVFSDNPEAQAHLEWLADKANRGLVESLELSAQKDENEIWLLVTAQPVKGHKGCVHWRIDDVTDQYMADRSIREEREKLIDFTDNAPLGFFSADETGRLVFANATLARWLGIDLETLLQQGILHNFIASSLEKARPYDVLEKGGGRQVTELMMKGTGGRTFLASVNQVVVQENDGSVRTRAVVNDLTTQSEMQTALQESEARFRKFFEQAPVGIVLLDKDGAISDSNQRFASMLGRTLKQLDGTAFETLLEDKAQLGDVRAMIASAEENDTSASSAIDVRLSGVKSPVQAQMYARRFRESGHTVLHFIDVSEKKQLEEQFVQSQKMQAIGQLAGGVAHDFNNLLTAIVGFCDLLLLRHKPGDPSFGDLMQIKQNSNRAANLVRQLLAFSRQQTLRPKVQDLSDILIEVSHLLRRLIGASVELDLKHGQDLGLVKVDEGQMEQVLINLAVNARDAMEGAGKLTVETENFTNKKKKELLSEDLPAGKWVKIMVTDTGSGISPENLSRVFEPFFTTKAVGEGTGLGLATVYGIVRQTDGYLDVQSELGKGTTFTIYLPRSDESELDATETSASQEEAAADLTGTERILLVEDEDAVRTFSERALTNKGYEVVSAETGEAALSLMATMENKKLDLVITDVVMPQMDGPTLVQRIRQESPHLKVIFVSGYTEDKLKDYMAANTYFLPKPFTLKQLAEKVKAVLKD